MEILVKESQYNEVVKMLEVQMQTTRGLINENKILREVENDVNNMEYKSINCNSDMISGSIGKYGIHWVKFDNNESGKLRIVVKGNDIITLIVTFGEQKNNVGFFRVRGINIKRANKMIKFLGLILEFNKEETK